MSKHRPKFPYMMTMPATRHASLEELKRRAAPLRTAIAHERDLARVVDRFFDAFSNEERLYETSSTLTRMDRGVLMRMNPAGR